MTTIPHLMGEGWSEGDFRMTRRSDAKHRQEINASLFDFSAFHQPVLIASGLCCILIEFAQPFFLVLFLLRDFLLTLLKTEIRFCHWMPPEEEIRLVRIHHRELRESLLNLKSPGVFLYPTSASS